MRLNCSRGLRAEKTHGSAVIFLSLIFIVFLVFAGAVKNYKPVFCAESCGLGKSELKNCVYELYLYEKSSGSKALTFAANDENFIRNKKLLLGSAVKGERIFIPKEEIYKLKTDKSAIAQAIVKKLNAEKIFCESGENFFCEYYYSGAIKNFSVINGKKINVHISYTEAGVSVSSPVAFGMY